MNDVQAFHEAFIERSRLALEVSALGDAIVRRDERGVGHALLVVVNEMERYGIVAKPYADRLAGLISDELLG